jgi:hypothetical protein
MKANGSKSAHATFTTGREACSSVHINNVQLPQAEDVEYLGLHLDRRLTWHMQNGNNWVSLTKMYWLLGRKSHLTISNKSLICTAILKPVWTYGMKLRGSSSTSNIEILERF